MLQNKNKRKIKIQNSVEYIIILVVVAMIALGIGVYYINSTHNVSVGTSDEIVSAQASSSNTLLLELSELLPTGAQIKGINFTGVPSGTTFSVSLESQTPVYVNGYPEYNFSVIGLPEPLPYYNVTSLTYEVNGKTIAVPTITGEPMAIEGTNGYNGGSTLPSGIIAYVPISISNNQNVATPSPFQQMITFNPSSYSQYENSNLGNIRFYQGSTELYSWCESGCSNTSSNAVFWIKLPNGINANSNIIINMTFGQKSTNYDGNYAGEAPQLSPTYGEYDNGANVFNNYWNFAGTSLPSGWTSSGSVSINNGVTIGTSQASGSISQSSYTINPQTTITDTYWYENGTIDSGVFNFALGNPSVPTTWGFTGFGFLSFVGSYEGYTTGQSNYNGGEAGQGGWALPSQYWIGGIWTNTGGSCVMMNYNFASCFSVRFTPSTATAISFSSTTPYITYVQWVRTRALPPNGIMPSASFGSIQQV